MVAEREIVPESIHEKSAQNAKAILKFLSQKDKATPLLILTHDYPDPDALASAFALDYIARSGFGIQSRIAYGGVIGRMENKAMVQLFKIPAHPVHQSNFRKYADVALVDTQPSFENNSFPKGKKASLVIDQHQPLGKIQAEIAIVDTDCGATSVIMAETLLKSRLPIPVPIASSLAYGILSDTMGFYRSNRPDVIETYLKMVPHCDFKALARIQNPFRSKSFFQTLRSGIQNARIFKGLLISHLGKIESPDLVAQTTDFLLTYKPVKWAFCTGRFRERLYVSLRLDKMESEDAGEILRDVVPRRKDAGGHDVIAGGSFLVGKESVEEKWKEAESLIIEKLRKRLKISKKGDFSSPFRERSSDAPSGS